jgi:NAD+ kinase
MARVLLLAKTPLAARLAEDDLARLRASGALDDERLRSAASCHHHALQVVRQALHGEQMLERTVDAVSPADADGIDLLVTVGGDGTVFAANALLAEVPLLAVNSDPQHSIGHFCRANASSVGALIGRWRAGQAQLEELPRLEVEVGGRRWRILNDCLFSSVNPAAMTRYVLDVDGQRERQRSSGVWVASGAGSTAAIRSAGAAPVDAHRPALLYRVREPFPGREPSRLLEGTQLPPRGLVLTPVVPGISLYLDGPNSTVALQAGEVARFHAAQAPLRLVCAAS